MFGYEPCSLLGGGDLPVALVAPGEAGKAALYWYSQTTPPVQAGQVVIARLAKWLVTQVDTWVSGPGGIHAHLLHCNAEGTLTRRTATVSGYGVQLTSQAPVEILGALTVTSTADPDGNVQTTGQLVPAGTWQGLSGDLVELVDGTEWEQVGDLTSPAGGLPVVQLRRVRA
ncbi:MAG: hypothetical protein QM695_15850 [Micropruina sp.]